MPEARSARALEIDSSPVSVCTFYYEPCDLVRSIALGMDISELAFKSWRNSLTSLKRAGFCFHLSGFESSTEHCFFRTFRVFSFFGTFRAHPISTSEGSFCVRLLVVFCVELVSEHSAIVCGVKTHPFFYIVFILHLVLFSPFPSLSARSPSRETINQFETA